eukprot:scaffold91714_cov42-Phaeocystis_antarctica.AAC.1
MSMPRKRPGHLRRDRGLNPPVPCFRLESQARLRHHELQGLRRARFIPQLQCEARGKLDASHPVTKIAARKSNATWPPLQEHCTSTDGVDCGCISCCAVLVDVRRVLRRHGVVCDTKVDHIRDLLQVKQLLDTAQGPRMLECTMPRFSGILANRAGPEMQGSIVPACLHACARKVCGDVQRAMLACLLPRSPRKQIVCRHFWCWHLQAPVVLSIVRGCSEARSLPGRACRQDPWWNEATTNAPQAPRPMRTVGKGCRGHRARDAHPLAAVSCAV